MRRFRCNQLRILCEGRNRLCPNPSSTNCVGRLDPETRMMTLTIDCPTACSLRSIRCLSMFYLRHHNHHILFSVELSQRCPNVFVPNNSATTLFAPKLDSFRTCFHDCISCAVRVLTATVCCLYTSIVGLQLYILV